MIEIYNRNKGDIMLEIIYYLYFICILYFRMINRIRRQFDSRRVKFAPGIVVKLAASFPPFRRRERNVAGTPRVHSSSYHLSIGKRNRYELRIQSCLNTSRSRDVYSTLGQPLKRVFRGIEIYHAAPP